MKQTICLILTVLLLLPLPCAADDSDELYTVILEGLQSQAPEIDLSAFHISENYSEMKRLAAIYRTVVYENAALYYVTSSCGFSTTNSGELTILIPVYQETPVDAALFERTAAQIISKCVQPGMSAETVVFSLYAYMTTNCFAQGQPETNGARTAYGAIVNQSAAQEGFALALRYLLDAAGFDARVVASAALETAWNAVKIEDFWYHIGPRVAGRALFLVTDARMRSMGYPVWDTILPPCTDEKYQNGYQWNDPAFPADGTQMFWPRAYADGIPRFASAADLKDAELSIEYENQNADGVLYTAFYSADTMLVGLRMQAVPFAPDGGFQVVRIQADVPKNTAYAKIILTDGIHPLCENLLLW